MVVKIAAEIFMHVHHVFMLLKNTQHVNALTSHQKVSHKKDHDKILLFGVCFQPQNTPNIKGLEDLFLISIEANFAKYSQFYQHSIPNSDKIFFKMEG